jgi:hypothetical protein
VTIEAEQRRQEEERRKDASVKSRFEYLKHLTTLAGATAAVEVAIFQTENLRNERLDGVVMVVSLIFLAGAIAIALGRMMWLIDLSSVPGKIPEYACTLMVLGGVFYFVLRAVGWRFPDIQALINYIGLGVGLVAVLVTVLTLVGTWVAWPVQVARFLSQVAGLLSRRKKS